MAMPSNVKSDKRGYEKRAPVVIGIISYGIKGTHRRLICIAFIVLGDNGVKI